jgi:hypothetical protein
VEERPSCGILLGEASHMPQAILFLEEEWKEDFPKPTTNSKAHGEKSMSSSPYNNAKNFFHHYKLSGHWEEKCW